MLTSDFLIYRARPSQAQIRITSGVALALFLAFVAALFCARLPLPRFESFLPIIDSIQMAGALITATLLFAQARVLRFEPLGVLGAGFFFSGLMLIPLALTFPGAFAPDFLGADANTAVWLSTAAQPGLPLAIMAYAWLRRLADQKPQSLPRQTFGLYLIVPVVAAILLTLLATVGRPLLPSLTVSPMHYASAIYLAVSPGLLMMIAAIVMVRLGQRSMLDLWLQISLWGLVLKIVLVVVSSGRFTVGWYVGGLMALLSSQFVLFTLLAETITLYARSVQQLMAERQEQENRLLIRDAAVASIAHELRQPLSAILLNAEVMQQGLAGQHRETAELLDDVIACSRRANDIIQSTPAIFERQTGGTQSVDLGALLRGTLAMVEGSARALDVSVALALEWPPGPVKVNRLQMQQALLNLFQNAIEALGRVSGRPRILTVRCALAEKDSVTIRVEDNGPGIAMADRERIFAPFFTTRTEGTGLGLAITRQVVETHGGQIGVEPLSPFGTAFVIQLPYGNGEAV